MDDPRDPYAIPSDDPDEQPDPFTADEPADHQLATGDPGEPEEPGWDPFTPVGAGMPVDALPSIEADLGRRSPAGKVIAFVVALLLVVGAGATAVLLRDSRTETAIEAAVPADALVFAKAALKPSTDQQRALRQLLDRLPASEREEVGDRIDSLLESALRSTRLSYRRDVKPWLGDQIGVAAFVEGGGIPQVLVVMTADDEGAAQAALKAANIEPASSFEVRDGVVFIAERRTLIDKALSTTEATSLQASAAFKAAQASIGDTLAYVYVDPQRAQDLVKQLAPGALGALPLPSNSLASGASIGLRAEEGALVLTGRSQAQPSVKAGPPELLRSAPSNLLGSLTVFDLGAGIEQFAGVLGMFSGGLPGSLGEIPGTGGTDPPGGALNPLAGLGLDLAADVVPWLHGELTLVVGGLVGTIPEVGILVRSTDDAALKRTLDTLAKTLPAAGSDAGFAVTPASDGFSLEFGVGVTVVVKRSGDTLVIATSPAYASKLLGPDGASTVADDVVFRRAVGATSDQTQFLMFVRLDRVRAIVEGLIPAGARAGYDGTVGPFLRPFEALSIEQHVEGDQSVFRMALSVADRS